jgi:diacylglycerol kinase (ATP)
VDRSPKPTAHRLRTTVEVDGQPFFKGRTSCVLAGNVGKVFGGLNVFPGARPDSGLLELGVVTARNPVQWARALGRVAVGSTAKSPFVEMARGTTFKIRFDRAVPYQLDGGDRPATRKLRIKVHPGSITVCVPTRSAASAS